MRTITCMVACMVLACSAAWADTLYVTDLGFTTIYTQVVDQLDDSAMLANDWQRVGNLYLDKIVRSDSSTYWVGCGDGFYMAVPIGYDILAVVQRQDVNGSGMVDISDLLAVIDFMFGG